MKTSTLALASFVTVFLLGAGHASAQPCDITPEPGDITEDEACGADTNGGCNSWFGGLPVPDVFEPAACGDSFFGSVWADIVDQTPTRDTDWYLFSHPGGLVTFTLTAELPSVNFFVGGIDTVNGVCSPVLVGAFGWSDMCIPDSVTEDLPAGEYVAFVATGDSGSNGIFDGYPCDSNNSYRLSIDCGVKTLVLTPPGAFNLTGTTHTVYATVNGAEGFCTLDNADPCFSDSDCEDLAEGTCDFSGHSVGFRIAAGPNAGDYGFALTNSAGVATLTYPDTGGAGVDDIQACWDTDGDDTEVDDCFADDVLSNPVTKTWSDVTVTLTPEVEYNPIGTTHVLTATSTGLPMHCAESEGFGICTSDADCNDVVGSCSLAGYPVFFAVVGTCVGGSNGGAACLDDSDCDSNNCVGGPNLGELPIGVTDADGVATSSYSSLVEGVDNIQACLDGDPLGFGVDDELGGGFLACLNDSFYELDVPSNIVTKSWFANFVNGGAGVSVVVNKKKSLQFSGIIGRAGSPGIQGQWNAATTVSGKAISCHFDSFTSLVFSGPPATNPASTHNTATFTTGPGRCNDGSTPILTATVVDYGEGKKIPRDTINVSGDVRFSTGGTKNLATGNLQVHSITP